MGGQNIDELLELLDDDTVKASYIIQTMQYEHRGNSVSKKTLTSLIDEVVRGSSVQTAATILYHNDQVDEALELVESHLEYVTAARIAEKAELYARAATNYEFASRHTDNWEDRNAYLRKAIGCCIGPKQSERAIGILLSQQDNLNSELHYKEAAEIARAAGQHSRKRALLMTGYKQSLIDKDVDAMKVYANELKDPELLVDGFEKLGEYGLAAIKASELGQTERATDLRKKDLLEQVSNRRCNMSGRRYTESNATNHGLQAEYVDAMIDLVRKGDHYERDVEDTAKYAVKHGMLDKAFEICELGEEFTVALHIARDANDVAATRKYEALTEPI